LDNNNFQCLTRVGGLAPALLIASSGKGNEDERKKKKNGRVRGDRKLSESHETWVVRRDKEVRLACRAGNVPARNNITSRLGADMPGDTVIPTFEAHFN